MQWTPVALIFLVYYVCEGLLYYTNINKSLSLFEQRLKYFVFTIDLSPRLLEHFVKGSVRPKRLWLKEGPSVKLNLRTHFGWVGKRTREFTRKCTEVTKKLFEVYGLSPARSKCSD